ncbi:uncharacterized GPI-anchored protein At1g61900-like isoform X1 [Camellia sinensis]|uniref:uncharacterized GPI-anchored protein At1g61900-like isoform X1 n=2 Tax=Camellia sinensis TaxID=4442 RepID=UPI001036675F|nr:uncharacterized GPI-anchored protein At1g61900-like isoform X1 [Camellia sinensis]XP_028101826.1 uncharacterized GPI-anchored protein At1g61900-like isoform X1 [Camellia sinensis]XP_028101827.1 uncharacterized GPI-anchored protein At1g61900-like isoform X1 [Camellia sinensis]XP_028101828.1 uncharacterized GPI-anchored protein At1g61900-like isoform X1 [Camellia sinensis]
MDCVKTVSRLKGSLCHWFLFFTIWLSSFQDVVPLEMKPDLNRISFASELASPPRSELFQPIEISPAVIPHYPFPGESLPPMYPTFPTTYDPVLTGKCPVNLSALSDIMDKTASDCSQPLAAFVGNVICCPQFSSLLRIFQGYYSTTSDKLVLLNATANDCFSDIVTILASRRANSSIPTICSANPSNLTGGFCPVRDVTTFEKTVNMSRLLEACSTVDPLKECCRPICKPAIMEAALQISAGQALISDNKNIVGGPNHVDALNDCKEVVYSWLSSKLPLDAANTAFRILSACKVNKVCPLDFKQPSEVIKACRNVAAPSPSCCSSLNTYIAGIQKQMLITNRQAIICATVFGSMLQKGGVMTDVYELCDVDLKDFSLQAYGQQGCLLRSFPADVVYDNSTGFSFTCDLSDNIAAPWPSSSSITSLSLCAPEMSLPALPTSETLGSPGYRSGVEFLVPIFSFFVFSTLLY